MEKQTYDVRGRITMLGRLWPFDKEGFLHMVTFRIFVFVGIATGIVLLYAAIFNPGFMNSMLVKALVLLVWLFFTAQIYAASWVLAFMLSKGRASENINKSFVDSPERKSIINDLLKFVPYTITTVWLIGFAAMLAVTFL